MEETDTGSQKQIVDTISLRRLQEIVNHVFDDILEKCDDPITLTCDYYFDVPQDFRYDLSTATRTFENEVLDVGQLTEDWKDAQKMVDPDYACFPLDFVHLAGLMRYVGETYQLARSNGQWVFKTDVHQ